jgi:hypothetical protein
VSFLFVHFSHALPLSFPCLYSNLLNTLYAILCVFGGLCIKLVNGKFTIYFEFVSQLKLQPSFVSTESRLGALMLQPRSLSSSHVSGLRFRL